MKLYKVTNTVTNKATWAGTQSAVVQAKKVFMADGAKRKDLGVEEIDVPTKKDELIEWLNKSAA